MDMCAGSSSDVRSHVDLRASEPFRGIRRDSDELLEQEMIDLLTLQKLLGISSGNDSMMQVCYISVNIYAFCNFSSITKVWQLSVRL